MQTFASAIDFTALQELDPTLDNQFNLVFDEQVIVRLLPTGSQENDRDIEYADQEPLRIKVCFKGEEHFPLAVKLELQSEQDIFFNFTHLIEEENYRKVQLEQDLRGEFHEYA